MNTTPNLLAQCQANRATLLAENAALIAACKLNRELLERTAQERDTIKSALVDLTTALSEQYNADGLTGFKVIRDYHAAVAALRDNTNSASAQGGSR